MCWHVMRRVCLDAGAATKVLCRYTWRELARELGAKRIARPHARCCERPVPTDQHYTWQVALYLIVALTYGCAVVFVVKARTPLRKWLGASFLVTYLENVVAFPAAMFGDERYRLASGPPGHDVLFEYRPGFYDHDSGRVLSVHPPASAVAPVRSHPTAASVDQHPAIGFDGFFHVVRCGFDRAERERLFRLLHDNGLLCTHRRCGWTPHAR